MVYGLAGALQLYGLPDDPKQRYELFVGLHLNLSRARLQRADMHREGMALYHATELPTHYFDAVCAFEEEVAEMEFDVNAERAFAEVCAAHGVK